MSAHRRFKVYFKLPSRIIRIRKARFRVVGLAAGSPELVEGLRQGPPAFQRADVSTCATERVMVHERFAPLERGAGRRSAPCPTLRRFAPGALALRYTQYVPPGTRLSHLRGRPATPRRLLVVGRHVAAADFPELLAAHDRFKSRTQALCFKRLAHLRNERAVR